jgi:hypothetical protein
MAGFTSGADRVDCRVWLKYKANGTPSIYDDFNVASVTDHGTGDFSLIIDTDMGTASYCALATAGRHAGGYVNAVHVREDADPYSVGGIRFNHKFQDPTGSGPTLTDTQYMNVAIFGN